MDAMASANTRETSAYRFSPLRIAAQSAVEAFAGWYTGAGKVVRRCSSTPFGQNIDRGVAVA